MNLKDFSEKIKDFITFLEVEKNVSQHTLRAYSSDLNQLIVFWKKAEKKDERSLLSFDNKLGNYNRF